MTGGSDPQASPNVLLTDGGIETDLIFHHGVDLPMFATFVLHEDPASEDIVRAYFDDYLRIGAEYDFGLALSTLTWRASRDWGDALGYDAAALRRINEHSVEFVRALRDREGGDAVVVSGCIGPRGDAYHDLGSMDVDGFEQYHRPQIEVLAGSGVDHVAALTITNVGEAIGVARAARSRDVPVVISFTVETDGLLPTGMSVVDAITTVDESTDAAPVYYMINCAHPDHFEQSFATAHPALARIGGVRANASRQSHAELDESEDLDDGDPAELGDQLADLHRRAPNVTVLGGCCGTDHRHIEAIARATRASLSGGRQ